MLAMNENLQSIMFKYCNKHTLDNFKGRTVFDLENSDIDSQSTPSQSQKSPQSSGMIADSFSAAVSNNGSIKKRRMSVKPSIANLEKLQQEENLDDPSLMPMYIAPEHHSEKIYSDFLQRFMKFIMNLRGHTGWWREHIRLLDNLEQVVHLCYRPEVHQLVTRILFEMLLLGSK